VCACGGGGNGKRGAEEVMVQDNVNKRHLVQDNVNKRYLQDNVNKRHLEQTKRPSVKEAKCDSMGQHAKTLGSDTLKPRLSLQDSRLRSSQPKSHVALCGRLASVGPGQGRPGSRSPSHTHTQINQCLHLGDADDLGEGASLTLDTC